MTGGPPAVADAVPVDTGSGAAGYELRVLGPVELRRCGEPMAISEGGSRLLALLGLRGAMLRRGHVAGCLWPDKTEERAAANLRTTLWRLGFLPDLLVAARDGVGLGPGVLVDLDRAVQLAHTVVECPDLCPEPDALMPLASDLLPDWPEDWVAPERERFRQLRLHAVEAVARRLLDRGEVARSVELAVAAAAAAPLRESAHRLAIEAYLAQGRWHDARHQFECCRRALQGELGIEPTDALHDLMRPGLTRR